MYHRTHKQTRKKELASFAKQIKLKAREGIKAFGVYRIELLNVLTGEKKVSFHKNVLTIAGFTMIMNNLTDATPDNDMLISHAALGTNATLVDETNTTLGTETYRNVIASRTNAANVGYATAFFSQTEVDGTFKEAGIFSDGTGSADTGILISHVNIDVTKSNVQKLTIDWQITITNA